MKHFKSVYLNKFPKYGVIHMPNLQVHLNITEKYIGPNLAAYEHAICLTCVFLLLVGLSVWLHGDLRHWRLLKQTSCLTDKILS